MVTRILAGAGTGERRNLQLWMTQRHGEADLAEVGTGDTLAVAGSLAGADIGLAEGTLQLLGDSTNVIQLTLLWWVVACLNQGKEEIASEPGGACLLSMLAAKFKSVQPRNAINQDQTQHKERGDTRNNKSLGRRRTATWVH